MNRQPQPLAAAGELPFLLVRDVFVTTGLGPGPGFENNSTKNAGRTCSATGQSLPVFGCSLANKN